MANIIQIRRDSLSNWTSVNPILAEAEIGFETDTKKFKFGDGVTTYSALEYSTSNINLTGEVTSVGNIATVPNATVIGKVLTGYSSEPGTISATDTILEAIQKLNANAGLLVSGVSSFNSRTGSITLTSGDVTTGLGFTPYNETNPTGFTSFAEPGIFSGGGTPTLATGVTASEIRSLIGAGTSSTTGTLTNVTGVSPIISTGGATPAISIQEATSGASGYMTNTFASKLDGIEALADVTDAANVLTSLPEGIVSGSVQVDVTATTNYSTVSSHISNTSNPHSVTKTQVGLGNVDNESKSTLFTSPTFTGVPISTTPSSNDNSTKVATTAYVQTEITDLIGGAPAALDTLLEISTSIANGDSDVVALTTTVGTKLAKASNLSDLANASTARTNLGIAGGTSGQFLKHDGTFGTPSYTTNTNTTYTAGTNVTLTGTVFSSTDTNTTYSVGDGGLTQINFTSADNTKLDGIEASANNYSHPTGAGNNHVPTGGAVGNFLKYSSSGVATWVTPSYTTNTNTEYTAGSGISLTGTVFANTSPNIVQTTVSGNAGSATVLQNARTIAGVSFNGSANISLNNNAITNGAGYITSYIDTQLSTEQVQDIMGATWISGTNNTFVYDDTNNTLRINSTDTNTNTTYTAGAGLTLTGTVFSHTDTSSQASVNGSGRTYIQDITLDTYGHITGIATATETVTNTDTNTTTTADVKTALNASLGGAATFGNSLDTITFPGNITVTGTTTTNNVATVSTSNGVIFEGSTADANEVTLLAGTVTADRTITLPNATGTVALTSDIPTNNTQLTNGAGYITSYVDTNTVYTHPSYNGDDFSIDSGVLSGAVVISDIDINVTTDSSGHVTDANGTIATRTLTLANLGYSGATNANYITNNNQLTNGNSYISSYDITTQTDSKYLRSNATDTASGAITFSNATASTTKTTGAVIVTGGVGISGALNVGGDVVAYASSDERLKDNIEVISNPIEKVQQLKGVTWDWNSNADELQHTLPNVGVIAQDVEKVLPQLVIDRDNGFKGVDYAKLTGLLIEAIKDQQKQIEELKSKIS